MLQTHVSVLDKYKGRGVFSAMYALLETYALDHGFTELRLEVARNNDIAINCYLTKGFRYNGFSDSGYYMCKQLM